VKFRCDRDDLSEALQTVQRGVSSRPGIPALTGVLIEAAADGVVPQSLADAIRVPPGASVATFVTTAVGEGSIVVAHGSAESTTVVRVATYRGVAPQDPFGMSVIGWSSSGDAIIVRAAEDGPSAGNYSCAALFSIKADGSGATRLTATGPGSWISLVALSTDSGRVAFVQDDQLRAFDPQSAAATSLADCPAASSVQWSANSESILALCGDTLESLAAVGVPLRFTEDPAGVPLAAAWSPEHGGIVLVTARQAPEGFQFGPLTVFDVGVAGAGTTRRLETQEQAAWAAPSRAISPNARWLVTDAKVLRHNDFASYAVDLTTGAATELPWQVFEGAAGEEHFGWLHDGETLIHLDGGTLYALNLRDVTRTEIGRLPTPNFAWRNDLP